MIKRIIEAIGEKYTLRELEAGDMSGIKAKGLKFDIKAYYAAGLGHVSVMTAKGFFGAMRMDTIIINPLEKDLPLYSYDRIYAMGNDTLIVELYDTFLDGCNMSGLQQVMEQYKELPLRDPGEHWYDDIKLKESISVKAKYKQSVVFDTYAMKHLEAYLALEPIAGVVDSEAKKKKAATYVEGLLKHGGPSTDVFKKAIGDEKTENLFRTVLFGTGTPKA